jgi:hypothetical protein
MHKLSADKPHELQIPITLSTILNLIKPDSINLKQWKDIVIAELIEKFSKRNNAHSIDEEVNYVFNKALVYSSILDRIESATTLFHGTNEYDYLKCFHNVSNPN